MLNKYSVIFGLMFLSSISFAQSTEITPIKPDVVAATPADDQAITKTLKGLIGKSPLSKFNVEVSTNQGVVSIVGTVDSNMQAGSLIEMAESIIGVSDVDASKLNVKDSNQPLADTFTTAKVKGVLMREKLFGEKDLVGLTVETKNGVVYLSGVVVDKAQFDNAMQVIKKYVPEVKSVEYNVHHIVPETTSGVSQEQPLPAAQ